MYCSIVNMASNSSPLSPFNIISLRERGLLRSNIYREEIVKSQINRHPQKPLRVDNESRIYQFEYVRSSSEGNLVGITQSKCKFLHRTKVISRISVLKFEYNLKCQKGRNKKRMPLVSSLKTKKQLRECIDVADTADVHLYGKTPLLFAGNCYDEGLAGLTYFGCDGKNLDFEWRVQGRTFCCTSCDFSQQYALGCEDGYYLFNTVRMNEKHKLMHENVLSLQFNNDGNFLFLSTDRKGVRICDVREHQCFRRFCSLKNEFGMSCRKHHPVSTVSSPIREMKLLDDQIYLICADMEGYLEKVDIRMMKTIFSYKGHVGHKHRRCICLNEDLDLISTSGADQIVRIWSLSSGKMNYEKKVLERPFYCLAEEPPHCCFLTDQRRWFLSVIQDNILIPVSPTDEFPDSEEERPPYFFS